MRVLQYLAMTLFAFLSLPTQAVVTTHRGTIEAAAERVNVEPVALMAMAHLESRGNAKAQNRKSTAGGLMGFTNQTWRAYIARYGKQYGFTHRTSKYNARANALMAAHYMKDNERVLRRVLHRQPQPGELYMAHLLGLGGAIKILKAPSHRKATNILPSSAAGNRPYFYANEGKGKPRTVRQFRDYLNWQFTSIGSRYDTSEDRVIARL